MSLGSVIAQLPNAEVFLVHLAASKSLFPAGNHFLYMGGDEREREESASEPERKEYTKEQKEVAATTCKQLLWLGFKMKTREFI